MKIENKVFRCSNYATSALEEALDAFSNYNCAFWKLHLF